ncbi:MAG: hypothetical protein E7813_11165 [Bradyrhizobium sp.]|uniref:hypothetical protein n=1 Tax=Bradyrhizobium sp. TaxID=376 RepID=UPI0011F552CC|nr:hypothetical protein [Bradyrhizobium sp.]THD68190.1 MAG: hypothetical protein E7813_11165 [Bradyrhizobium sp.]
MIVVFKSGRSPSASGLSQSEEPRDRPITAVEKRCRYLVWWITIIKYNLKARTAFAGFSQPGAWSGKVDTGFSEKITLKQKIPPASGSAGADTSGIASLKR